MDFSEVPVACAGAAWLSKEFLPAVEDSVLSALPSVVAMPTDSHQESEFLLGRVKRFLEERSVTLVRELRLSPTDPSLAWESIFGTPDVCSSFDPALECNVLIVRGGNFLPAWFLSEHIGRLNAFAKSYRAVIVLPLSRSVGHSASASTELAVPSFATESDVRQRSFVMWAIEEYVNDLRDDPTVNRREMLRAFRNGGAGRAKLVALVG